jgi:hypothetical protein
MRHSAGGSAVVNVTVSISAPLRLQTAACSVDTWY